MLGTRHLLPSFQSYQASFIRLLQLTITLTTNYTYESETYCATSVVGFMYRRHAAWPVYYNSQTNDSFEPCLCHESQTYNLPDQFTNLFWITNNSSKEIVAGSNRYKRLPCIIYRISIENHKQNGHCNWKFLKLIEIKMNHESLRIRIETGSHSIPIWSVKTHEVTKYPKVNVFAWEIFIGLSVGLLPGAETMPSLDLIQWVQVFLRGKEVGRGDTQVDSMSRWKAERSKNALIPMSPSGQRVPLPSHLSLFLTPSDFYQSWRIAGGAVEQTDA